MHERDETRHFGALAKKGRPAPIALLPQAFPPGFPPNQQKAVLALLAGATWTAAAHAAGVGRATIYRWRDENPQFVAVLNQLRAELAESVLAEVRAMGPRAVQVLKQLMVGRRVPAAVRLRAALEVLDALRDQRVGPADEEQARRSITQRKLLPIGGKPLA
jgi:hypothetical protein